ncbi:MAG: Nif3-like dinuclear metal center hexameric protein [Verrucomicrobiota bacterium]
MAANLKDLDAFLKTYLEIDRIPDYPPALNGLQVANHSGEVTRMAAAVDACLPVIESAAAAGAQLLLVHHGLFWNGIQPIRDAAYQKLKTAFDHDLAIYSAHIPLDVHPDLGNNALLTRALGLTEVEPFFEWKGIQLGLRGRWEGSREALREKLSTAVGGSPVHLSPGGPESVRDVGVITGGAGGEVAAMAREGIDTFITGEGPHHTYALAEECGINLLYGGHYATETFGVKALTEKLANDFSLDHLFIDHPSGL